MLFNPLGVGSPFPDDRTDFCFFGVDPPPPHTLLFSIAVTTLKAWRRARQAEWYRGSLVFIKADDICINAPKDKNLPIPAGAIAANKSRRGFCIGERSCCVVAVAMEEETFMGLFPREFAAIGYPASYHTALLTAQARTRPTISDKRKGNKHI